MSTSRHHHDVPWCVAGPVKILYHATVSVNISVSYDERSVFGSHGAYAVWLGTAPRSYSISSNLVGANSDEVKFNLEQVEAAHGWTQMSPPSCEPLTSPITTTDIWKPGFVDIRIESYDASVDEAVHLDGDNPIQISLSLSAKECKPI